MRLSILAVLASLVISPMTARAEQVGVVVTGEATLQPQLAAQLERWLHDRGRTIVPGPLEPSAINTLIDCFVLEDLGCARGVVDTRSKSKSVVFARIETVPTDDGTRQVAVTAYMFQKNHDSNAERRVCTNCTNETLEHTVDGLMLALVHEPPPPSKTIKMQPADKTVAAVAAEPSVDPEPITDTPAKPFPVVPVALIAAGGVALVTGGVLVAIDEDPNPTGPQNPTYRDSATSGVVIGVVGAAALGAGIYRWTRSGKTSGPVAAIGDGGGTVGWAGRF